jgi:hypothetical protein
MSSVVTWYSGHNNYKKHTVDRNIGYSPEGYELIKFTMELLDVPLRPYTSLHEIIKDDLSVRQTKTVEILYSGGLDSECILNSCIQSKIPVRALTGRLRMNGYPINTHDLYYAEKFCREHDVEQVFVDLDVDKFLESGDYLQYMKPYDNWGPHVAIHFWLFEQSTGFPVLGGEYSWPWPKEKIISPHRMVHMSYDRFLQDRGIHGIGNMFCNSLEINSELIRSQLKLLNDNPNKYSSEDGLISHMKKDLYASLGFGNLELRMKSYGWDTAIPGVLDINKYIPPESEFGRIAEERVVWNQVIADALGTVPGSNANRGKP